MDFGLDGKLVLVTGSTAGIGYAIALKFLHAGAIVIINGRSDESCAKAKTRLLAEPAAKNASPVTEENIICISGDVSSAAGCKAFIEKVNAVGKPLEVLVNNAGIFEVKDFFEIDDEKWEEYYQVNVMSGVRLARAFLKPMLERNSGRVIFVSSEAGVRPLEHMVPYSVSKVSQISLARGLAELTKGTKVTVNSVLPGPTMTEGVRKYIEDFGKEKGYPDTETAVKKYFEENERTSLLQRFLEPEEVANTVLFVGSAAGSSINGAAQKAEGGIIRHI